MLLPCCSISIVSARSAASRVSDSKSSSPPSSPCSFLGDEPPEFEPWKVSDEPPEFEPWKLPVPGNFEARTVVEADEHDGEVSIDVSSEQLPASARAMAREEPLLLIP